MKKIILLLALFVSPVVNAWGDNSGGVAWVSSLPEDDCESHTLGGAAMKKSDEYLYANGDDYKNKKAYECGANGCDVYKKKGNNLLAESWIALKPGHVFQGITVNEYKVYKCDATSYGIFKDQMWVDVTGNYERLCKVNYGKWSNTVGCMCDVGKGLNYYSDDHGCYCQDGTVWNAEQDRCVKKQSQSSGGSGTEEGSGDESQGSGGAGQGEEQGDDGSEQEEEQGDEGSEQEEKQSQGPGGVEQTWNSEDGESDEEKCKKSGGSWFGDTDYCECNGFYGVRSDSSGKKCVCDPDKEINVYTDPDIAFCLAKSGTDVRKRRNFNMPKPTAEVLNCIDQRTGHMEGQLCCRIKDKATFIGESKSGVCVWNEKDQDNSYRVVVPYEEGYFWEGGYGQKFAPDSPEFTSVKNRLKNIEGAEKILCEIGRTDLMQNPKNCNNGTYTGSGTGENGNGTGSDNGTDSQNSESDSSSGSENTSDTEELKNDFAASVAKLESIAGRIKTTVWKDTEGNFNTSRLISDSVAGVVLGTAGGLITSSVVKKSQVKNGFEDINCTVGGQVVSGWGDQFNVGIQ